MYINYLIIIIIVYCYFYYLIYFYYFIVMNQVLILFIFMMYGELYANYGMLNDYYLFYYSFNSFSHTVLHHVLSLVMH
jgi:hypothetical protein